ncbi:putative defective protein IntQ [compost metagenome]
MQFAFWTGMRTSELVALDWGDIDWIRGEVRVSRAMTQAAKGSAEVTKTAAGARTIKLLGPALTALQAQKVHTFLAGIEVFQNPRTSERWAGDQPIRKTMWAPGLKKAGVRYRRPYQTRHTFASMMLSAGEHPMWVAQQMGHSDWTMIARVYGRWMPGADEQAGAKAEAVFAMHQVKRNADSA